MNASIIAETASYCSCNVLVIVIVLLIVLIITIIVLSYFRCRLVLDNQLNQIDNSRLILLSILISLLIVIVLWFIVYFGARAVHKLSKDMS